MRRVAYERSPRFAASMVASVLESGRFRNWSAQPMAGMNGHPTSFDGQLG
jgi:hypothetical protein